MDRRNYLSNQKECQHPRSFYDSSDVFRTLDLQRKVISWQEIQLMTDMVARNGIQHNRILLQLTQHSTMWTVKVVFPNISLASLVFLVAHFSFVEKSSIC